VDKSTSIIASSGAAAIVCRRTGKVYDSAQRSLEASGPTGGRRDSSRTSASRSPQFDWPPRNGFIAWFCCRISIIACSVHAEPRVRIGLHNSVPARQDRWRQGLGSTGGDRKCAVDFLGLSARAGDEPYLCEAGLVSQAAWVAFICGVSGSDAFASQIKTMRLIQRPLRLCLESKAMKWPS